LFGVRAHPVQDALRRGRAFRGGSRLASLPLCD
jgi:hypothetical protein